MALRLRSWLVFACVIATLTAVSGAAAEAEPGVQNGPIVHIVSEDGTMAGDLRATDPDGTYTRTVARGLFRDPHVSPDGSRVIVTELGEPGATFGAIVAVDLGTGQKTTLVDDGAIAAVWSSEGSGFAYGTDESLIVDDLDSDPPRTLFYVDVRGVWDWSPGGERILFSALAVDGFFYSLFGTADARSDESAIEALRTADEDWRVLGADFSPDGGDVVLGSSDGGDASIEILSEDRPIAEANSSGAPLGPVTWSPDGAAIAFPRSSGDSEFEMVVVDLASGEEITWPLAAPGALDWAPFGPSSPGQFEDVPIDGIHREAIDWLAREGVAKGCNPPANTRFCPGEAVTRGQMAAFLVRAVGFVDGSADDRFVDDDGSVFEDDIDRLARAGVTIGCNPPANTRFCPESLVTREQMATFLFRALAPGSTG